MGGLDGESQEPWWTPTPSLVVPVATFDRRAIVALEHAQRRADAIVRAVHVAGDDGEATTLGLQWLQCGLPSLEIIDPEPGATIEDTVAGWVRKAALAQVGPVTVVIGRVTHRRRWEQILHRRTGARVANLLA